MKEGRDCVTCTRLPWQIGPAGVIAQLPNCSVLSLATSEVWALCLTAQFPFSYHSDFQSFLVSMSWWMLFWYSGSGPPC